jgi:hypothetical protein
MISAFASQEYGDDKAAVITSQFVHSPNGGFFN